jgi:hypothetical protein
MPLRFTMTSATSCCRARCTSRRATGRGSATPSTTTIPKAPLRKRRSAHQATFPGGGLTTHSERSDSTQSCGASALVPSM